MAALERLRRVTIRVPEGLFRRLAIHCIETDQTRETVVQQALEAVLAKPARRPVVPESGEA